MHLRQSTRLRLLRTLKERILRWIVATDEAAIPKYCNEDEPQGAQKAPFRAGPFCFDLVVKVSEYHGCLLVFVAKSQASILSTEGFTVGSAQAFKAYCAARGVAVK